MYYELWKWTVQNNWEKLHRFLFNYLILMIKLCMFKKR